MLIVHVVFVIRYRDGMRRLAAEPICGLGFKDRWWGKNKSSR